MFEECSSKVEVIGILLIRVRQSDDEYLSEYGSGESVRLEGWQASFQTQ